MKKFSFILLLIFFTLSCSQDEKKVVGQNPKIIKHVIIDTIKYTKLKDEIKLSGTIIPKDGARILSKVVGEVKIIYLSEGDYVKKDQLILSIDDRVTKPSLIKLYQV